MDSRLHGNDGQEDGKYFFSNLLEAGGCRFYREGKGDHKLYIRFLEEKKRVVPIDVV
jgi:hypothetical protein